MVKVLHVNILTKVQLVLVGDSIIDQESVPSRKEFDYYTDLVPFNGVDESGEALKDGFLNLFESEKDSFNFFGLDDNGH